MSCLPVEPPSLLPLRQPQSHLTKVLPFLCCGHSSTQRPPWLPSTCWSKSIPPWPSVRQPRSLVSSALAGIHLLGSFPPSSPLSPCGPCTPCLLMPHHTSSALKEALPDHPTPQPPPKIPPEQTWQTQRKGPPSFRCQVPKVELPVRTKFSQNYLLRFTHSVLRTRFCVSAPLCNS